MYININRIMKLSTVKHVCVCNLQDNANEAVSPSDAAAPH